MTSARGQNVSVLHFHGSVEPWDPPITTFTDSGGSLRSAPRSSCFKIDRDAFVDGKSPKQCFVGNSFSGSFAKNHSRGFASSKGFNVTMTSVDGSSSSLNNANRELSPVRWCDREVDGVYLGKSGWVQVHQKSLDDGNKVIKNENVGVSALPPRINFSDFYSDEVVDSKLDSNRPSYLALSMKNRGNRENRERPCNLFQDIHSMSPPSLTPIISPPPAFKDRGLEAEFHVQDGRKVFPSKSSAFTRSKAMEEFGDPPKAKEKWDALGSASSGFISSSSAFASKHHGHPSRVPQTNSLDDTFSSRRRHDRDFGTNPPLSLFGFRSLDSDVREVDRVRFGKEMPHKKSFDCHENERSRRVINENEGEDYENDEDDEDEEGCRERHVSRPRSSPRDIPNGQRTLPRSSGHRNPQRNVRRISGSELASTSKYKEKSLHSSSSSCGSSCSSPDRKSPTMGSRKLYSKQSQQSLETCVASDGKHFNVKRSRSLQLSEKRSPNDLLLMTHSSSGKSWDQMPSEYSTFPDKSKNNSKRLPPLQGSQQLVLRANSSSCADESLFNLNFRRAEEKMMKEADKEVRIITEFLNGTRSRAAARNLLLHRYLNRPEDEGPATTPTEFMSDSDYGVQFLSTDRKAKMMVSPHPNEVLAMRTQPTERQFFSLSRDFRHRAGTGPTQPLTFFLCDPAIRGDSGRYSKQPQNLLDQKKMKKTVKKNTRSSIVGQESTNETEWKKNNRVGRRFDHFRPMTSSEKPQAVTSHQLEKLKTFHDQNGERYKNNMDVVSNKSGHPTGESESEAEGRGRVQSVDDSSSASSWSSDFWRDSSPAKNASARKSSGTRSPTESGTLSELACASPDSESLTRPGSAPANDDFATRGIDQRSLSLPRSFLSDLYGFRNFHQRSVFPRKLHGMGKLHHDPRGWNAAKGNARTAPATPVNDLRDDRRKEMVNGISSIRSSIISLASEPPPLSKPQLMGHMLGRDAADSLVPNESLTLGSDKLSGTSSRSVLQKFKKNLSSKFTRTKGMAKVDDRRSRSEKDCESEKENLSTATSGLILGLQNVENDVKFSKDLLRGSPNWKGAKEQKLWRKALKSAKYGSHDSGIQMGNRGNVDSSESQDTDLQEETDSPVSVRRRNIHGKKRCGRPQSEIFNQLLLDKFKADVERLNKSKEVFQEKGVRRTNSDLGGQRLYNWNVKNPYRRNPCSMKGRSAATGWTNSNEGILRNLTMEQTRPQLRRSVSQPLGLDELPSFVRRSSAAKGLTWSEDEQNLQGRQAEDEFVSDSECSIASLGERKKVSELSLSEDSVILAEAVWDHVSMEPSELPFRAGDVIEVLDTRDKDWWWGARGQNCGYFPSVFVRLRVSQEDTVEDCLAAMAKGSKNSCQLRRGKSISLLSNDQVRSGVVRELLNTERDFVKILRNVREGFVFECRRRTDMFTPAQVSAIFSNLEDLLVFQENFLKDLEERVRHECPHESCIGDIFLKHSPGFRMYSEYCNSHPMAIATLQELYQNERYVKFFETCRLKRSLIEIPLSGYLLTPVQRICKYPLQLAELLKYTKSEHPDFEMVREALETMRSVATLINERKRKMESLEKLAAWQQRVEGWEGEDLIEMSSQLIHQGDVVRITSGMWTSNITLFLFDHQILYCKKDLIKRNTYIYKGRILLDTSEVIDIPDGKDQQLGATVRHGLKIYSCSKDKWMLFCCKTAEDKAKWLEAFAEEKKVVTQDREGDLNLPPAARQLARMAARTKKGPPVKLTSKNNKMGSNEEELSSRCIRGGVPKAKLGRKVGTWFTFGGGRSPKMSPGLRSSPQRDT